MAEVQELDPDGAESNAGGEKAGAKSAGSRKKLIIIGAVATVLLLGGGGGAYALMSGGDGAKEESHAAAGEGADTFIDIPPMTVNLRSADGTPRFLRVHLMLVPASADDQDEITKKLPLVIDSYQPFLRELRPEDLAGSAAAFRLKEEMLIRANQQLGSGIIADVLIQDLVQQ
ncbi:flagellar basal body-associated FliL family protein [Novosphingobium sp. M1R2S20]|uniref:Flagellar protein FliL n=1 Tax=Novosphingobium rhizovicinum TaxID=3228928 RepID=A0ABV3RB24_9SPHN